MLMIMKVVVLKMFTMVAKMVMMTTRTRTMIPMSMKDDLMILTWKAASELPSWAVSIVTMSSREKFPLLASSSYYDDDDDYDDGDDDNGKEGAPRTVMTHLNFQIS